MGVPRAWAVQLADLLSLPTSGFPGSDSEAESKQSLVGSAGRAAGFGVALSAQGLHSASIPGILALDLCPSDTNKILTGKSRSLRSGARLGEQREGAWGTLGT